MVNDGILIIGASLAGLSTAVALRQQGYDGRIALVGDEPHLPYDRPPLSKQLLVGSWSVDQLELPDARRLTDLGIDVVLDARATGLDAARHRVTFAGGESMAYGTLVVATGVRPRRLPALADQEGIHHLRSIADSVALRADVIRTGRLLILGAGFIGLEVACSAKAIGVDVVVVDPDPAPLASRIGSSFSQRLLESHRAGGVDLRLGRSVTSYGTVAGRVDHVVLSDGARIEASSVLVGVGTEPNVEWLAGSGLADRRGLLCDSTLRAAPDVYGAGDVVATPDARTGLMRRHEHRMTATGHGFLVAGNVVGESKEHGAVPFFWTDQWSHRIQVMGDPTAATEVRTEELNAPRPDSAVTIFGTGSTAVAVAAWNAPTALSRYRRDMEERTRMARVVTQGSAT